MEVIKGKRAVAYFDILGFKEKVENMTIDQLARAYEQLISNTDGRLFDIPGDPMRREMCKRFIFSDSVFLVALEDTEKGFIDLFTFAWRMMQIAFATNFPLRGAITYGDVYVNYDKSIFIGESIVKAAVWEGKQDWMGAVVDKAAIERYSSIFDGDDVLNHVYRTLILEYPVPLKNGTVENQYVLNWRTNIISQHGIKALFQYDESNEGVKRKVLNTLAFAKSIRDQHIELFNGELVPRPYTHLFISDHDPKEGVHAGDEY